MVEAFVEQAVATAEVNSELKRSFKRHSRYNLFIDNIVNEANKLPQHLVTRDNLQNVCTDFTHSWLALVSKFAYEKSLSHAAKQAILDKADKAKKQEQIVDDMNDGKEIDAERIAEVAE